MVGKDLKKELGQVWTPDWLVTQVLNEAGYAGETVLFTKILEPSFGAGAFLRKIVERIFVEGSKRNYSSVQIGELIDENVYGVEYDNHQFTQTKASLIELVSETYGVIIALPHLYNQDALDFGLYNFFDFVVGNPPYVRVHNLPEQMRAKIKKYAHSTGTTDLYIVFYELGVQWLNDSGSLSYIAPNGWLRSSSQKRWRKELVDRKLLNSIVDFGTVNVFPAFGTYTCIATLSKNNRNETVSFIEMETTETQKFATKVSWDYLEKFNGEPFIFSNPKEGTLLQRRVFLTTQYSPLSSIAKPQNGLATLGDKFFLLPKDFISGSKYVKSVVKGSTYKGEIVTKKIFFPYKEVNGKYVGIAEEELKTDEKLYELIVKNKEPLSKRALDKNSLWFWYGRSQAIQETGKRKLVVSPVISPHQTTLKTFIVPEGTLVYSGLFLTANNNNSLEEIQQILENEDFVSVAKILGKNLSGGYKTFNTSVIRNYLI